MSPTARIIGCRILKKRIHGWKLIPVFVAICLSLPLQHCVLARNISTPEVIFERHVLITNVVASYSLSAVDLNGDGRTDILPNMLLDPLGQAVWFESQGEGETTYVSCDLPYQHATYCAVSDLNNDGNPDIIVDGAVPEEGIAWLRNSGGSNPTFTLNIIGYRSHPLYSVTPADFDRDGDIDIFVKDGWYENDGASNPAFGFRPESGIGRDGRHVGPAADVDLDGDMDIIGWGFALVWTENLGNYLDRFHEREIPPAVPDDAFISYLCVDDLDRDGNPDIIVGRNDIIQQLEWYENEGSGRFRPYYLSPFATDYVLTADVDGDGTKDIIYTGPWGLRWCKVTANPYAITNPIGVRHFPLTDNVALQTLAAADMDNDGDTDIIAGSTDTIYLYENLTPPIGTPTPSPTPDISPTPTLTPGPADFDHNHDGRIDTLDLLLFQSHWHETSYE